MKTYSLKLRRKGQWFWRTEKNIIGHRYDSFIMVRDDNNKDVILRLKLYDKLVIQYSNGSMKEIANYKDYDVQLTRSWYEFTRDAMNKDAGQNLAFSVP